MFSEYSVGSKVGPCSQWFHSPKAGGASTLRDFEVLRLDVAVGERDVRGAHPVLFEIDRVEPLALFRRIDRDQVVLSRRQPTDLVFAGLIRTGRHDLARLRPPQRRVGGEG